MVLLVRRHSIHVVFLPCVLGDTLGTKSLNSTLLKLPFLSVGMQISDYAHAAYPPRPFLLFEGRPQTQLCSYAIGWDMVPYEGVDMHIWLLMHTSLYISPGSPSYRLHILSRFFVAISFRCFCAAFHSCTEFQRLLLLGRKAGKAA